MPSCPSCLERRTKLRFHSTKLQQFDMCALSHFFFNRFCCCAPSPFSRFPRLFGLFPTAIHQIITALSAATTMPNAAERLLCMYTRVYTHFGRTLGQRSHAPPRLRLKTTTPHPLCNHPYHECLADGGPRATAFSPPQLPHRPPLRRCVARRQAEGRFIGHCIRRRHGHARPLVH